MTQSLFKDYNEFGCVRSKQLHIHAWLGGKTKQSILSVRELNMTDSTITKVATITDESYIIVLGKSGNGKSATCNSLLQKKCFESRFSSKRVTADSAYKESIIHEKHRYGVVDTPGLFCERDRNNDLTNEFEIQNSIKRLREKNAKVNAFLLVLSCCNWFTEEEFVTIRLLKMMFGKDMVKHTIVVFTHTDALEGSSLPEFYEENPHLLELIKQFGYRVVGINNTIDSRAENGIDNLTAEIKRLQMKEGSYDCDIATHQRSLNELQKIAKALPRGAYGKIFEALDIFDGIREGPPMRKEKENSWFKRANPVIFASIGVLASFLYMKRA